MACVTPETKKLTLLCCNCSAEIDESAAFSYAGAFGCEKCVISYCRGRRAADVETELRERRREAICMLPYARKELDKLAAKKTARNKKTALIAAELKTLVLLCVECGAEIDISSAFQFGGSVACEKCVSNYYRNRPAELQFELQSRRRNAVAWVKRNRKTLEKQAAKRATR